MTILQLAASTTAILIGARWALKNPGSPLLHAVGWVFVWVGLASTGLTAL